MRWHMAFTGNIPVGYLQGHRACGAGRGSPARHSAAGEVGHEGNLTWDAVSPQMVCSWRECPDWHGAAVRRRLEAMFTWDAGRSQGMCGCVGESCVVWCIWSWHSTGASASGSDVLCWARGAYWGMSCCRRSLMRLAVTGFPCKQRSRRVAGMCSAALKAQNMTRGRAQASAGWTSKANGGRSTEQLLLQWTDSMVMVHRLWKMN